MQVTAVGTELEDEFEAALPGSVSKHAEALCGLCLAGFIPEVEAFLRLCLGPVGTYEEGVCVVAHLDFSHG